MFAVSEWLFPSSETQFLHQLDEMLRIVRLNSYQPEQPAGDALLELQQVVDAHIYDNLHEVSVRGNHGGPCVDECTSEAASSVEA